MAGNQRYHQAATTSETRGTTYRSRLLSIFSRKSIVTIQNSNNSSSLEQQQQHQPVVAVQDGVGGYASASFIVGKQQTC
ncbi:MAG: hypothetical protein AAFO91_14810 [Bacteroidota bacterium]